MSSSRVRSENGGSFSKPVFVLYSKCCSVILPSPGFDLSGDVGDGRRRQIYGDMEDSSDVVAEWDEAEVAVGDMSPGLLL